MANRNWDDPREREEYERQRLQARRELDERRAGSGLGWWWVWWVVFIILIFWFAGWGWWGYGGWWGWGRRARVVEPAGRTNANNGAINNGNTANGTAGTVNNNGTAYGAGAKLASIPQLLSNPQSYEGQRVLIPTTVQQKVNNHTLLVGPDKDQQVAVTLPENQNTTEGQINQGEKVQISATVTKAPEQNQVRQNLGLNSQQATQVAKSGIYLEAYAVTPVSPNGQNGINGQVNR